VSSLVEALKPFMNSRSRVSIVAKIVELLCGESVYF
jgi:hypothetical protein